MPRNRQPAVRGCDARAVLVRVLCACVVCVIDRHTNEPKVFALRAGRKTFCKVDPCNDALRQGRCCIAATPINARTQRYADDRSFPSLLGVEATTDDDGLRGLMTGCPRQPSPQPMLSARVVRFTYTNEHQGVTPSPIGGCGRTSLYMFGLERYRILANNVLE